MGVAVDGDPGLPAGLQTRFTLPPALMLVSAFASRALINREALQNWFPGMCSDQFIFLTVAKDTS